MVSESAQNLRRNLRLVLATRRLGLPCVVVLNMVDLAAARGLLIDAEALSRELGLPVVAAVSSEDDGRLVATGTAARPVLADAALAAVTEMVQTEVSLDMAREPGRRRPWAGSATDRPAPSRSSGPMPRCGIMAARWLRRQSWRGWMRLATGRLRWT